MADPSNSNVGVLPQLVEWVEGHGGKVHRAVEINESPSCHGVGAFAAAPIARGEVLMRLPQEVLITYETVVKDPCIGTALRTSKLTPIVAIQVFLAYHHSTPSNSPWAVYLTSLPRTPPVPLYYSEDELALLNPSSVFDRLGRCIQAFAGEYHQLEELVLKKVPELQSVDFEAYKWAVATCLSRMFWIDGTATLLPIGDLLNHRLDGAVFEREVGTGAVVLPCSQAAAKGDELWVSYGGGGPFAYLFHYGFVDRPMRWAELHDRTLPWWLALLSPAGDHDPADLLLTSEAHCSEGVEILLSDLLPSDKGWVLEVPEEYQCVDFDVDVVAAMQRCRGVVATGGPAIDVERWVVTLTLQHGGVLPDEGGLCALRLLFAMESEGATRYRASLGSPVGPLSEVVAAAAVAGMLRSRIASIASSVSSIVHSLHITPTKEGGWARTAPSPPNEPRLAALGAALCSELVLCQKCLDEATLVPSRFATVSPGPPRVTRWR